MGRRTLLAASMVVWILGAGCTGPGDAPIGVSSAEPDLLFLRTAGGVTLLPSTQDADAITVPRAVPSTDWSTVVGAVRRGGDTRIVATDASSGRQLWTRDVSATVEVKVVSSRGALAALGRPDDGAGYVGRRSTTLVVVGQNLSEPRTLRLAGNYEPEAFSSDGRSLFVIQYLPARRPTSYRVRRLDLQTGDVEGVYSADAHLQEAMQGTARIQAASPDGRRLYTLYTVEGADGVEHAFIHVLSLDDLWAHCIDLPQRFAAARERAIALAVAPDGRLYVGDAQSGTMAEIDADRLIVSRTTRADFDSPGGVAHAAAGPRGAVFLGKGTRLVALDASGPRPERSWHLELDARILGLQAASDGTKLYVASRDGVVALDVLSGTTLDVLDSPSIGVIDQLGPSTRHLQERRRNLVCAC